MQQKRDLGLDTSLCVAQLIKIALKIWGWNETIIVWVQSLEENTT